MGNGKLLSENNKKIFKQIMILIPYPLLIWAAITYINIRKDNKEFERNIEILKSEKQNQWEGVIAKYIVENLNNGRDSCEFYQEMINRNINEEEKDFYKNQLKKACQDKEDDIVYIHKEYKIFMGMVITETNNIPLSNVQVKLIKGDEEYFGKSGNDGLFGMIIPSEIRENCQVEVMKTGYSRSSFSITVSDENPISLRIPFKEN